MSSSKPIFGGRERESKGDYSNMETSRDIEGAELQGVDQLTVRLKYEFGKTAQGGDAGVEGELETDFLTIH